MDWLQESFPGVMETVVETGTSQGLNILAAIAILLIGRMAAGWVRKLTARGLRKSGVDETLIPFASSLAYFAILAFTIVAVLGKFGVETASFIAVLGAAGLAVGLALQGSLSNFAAGVMLLIFRPFTVNDLIEAGGTLGIVRAIGVFSTQVDTLDNVRVIIPNSGIYGDKISNLSANPNRRVDMTFGVGYGDNLQLAKETIERIVKAHPAVLADPAPDVEVAELGDSSVNFVVRPWCKHEDYWTVNFDLHHQLKDGLEAAGLSIPFPQRDVHLHQVA